MLERRLEQKLWDAFRKPIDDAFQRKTQQREQASAAMNEHDRAVLQAAKALEQANASADAAAIRTAMRQLEMAMRGQAQAAATTPDAAVAQDAPAAPVETATASTETTAAASAAEPAETAATPDITQAPTDGDATAPHEASVTDAAAQASGDDLSSEPAVETAAPEPTPAVVPVAPAPPPKKVVAVRGDDRPGMKKAEPAAPMGRGFKGRDSRDAPRGRPGDAGRGREGFGAGGPRAAGPGRFERSDMGPRLGDAAFRAQRQALEQAELALKKLAAQAHGETLTHVLIAWEKRDAELLPPASELGARLPPAQRSQWVKALSGPANAEAETALLRLEMAAELPSPAASLEARRQLQLVLLTRRNDAPPHQTWAQDAAHVMSSAFEPGQARRLQNALKVLLRR